MLIDNYTLFEKLGKGAFGEVYLTSMQGSKEKFATKKIDKKFAKNQKTKEYIDNEIATLKEIDNENIIKLYEVKEDRNSYYLIMEYCNGGSLSDCLEYHIKKYRTPFSEQVVQYLMRQIVAGINYLNQKHILHRDIKLDNILVKFENEKDKEERNMLKAKVKIINLGFARHLYHKELVRAVLGTPININPKILSIEKRLENSRDYGYDEKADIWNLGTITYQMLIGKCAFDANSIKELLNEVKKRNYFLPTSLTKEAVSFINGMLKYDPKNRLTPEQLKNHKFLIKDFKDLTKIKLSNVNKNIYGNNIRINNKGNQSIWAIFGDDENSLENIKDNMVNVIIGDNSKKYSGFCFCKACLDYFTKLEVIDSRKMNENQIKNEFLKAFDKINEDFIYIEPKLIPIVPGDDFDVISKINEFKEYL